MTQCSLCPHPAVAPFSIGGIQGALCQSHSAQWHELAKKFVTSALRAERRRIRELESELVPRSFKRSA